MVRISLAQCARKVIGIDVDKEAMDYMGRTYKRENLEFYQTDTIEWLSEARSYDLIVMFEVIEHVLEQDRLPQAVRRALKDVGVLLLSTPNRHYTPFHRRNPYHVHEFLPDEILSLVEKHFTLKRFFGQVPGKLALLPLPWFLLTRIIQVLPSASGITTFNAKPDTSGTIVIVAQTNNHSVTTFSDADSLSQYSV